MTRRPRPALLAAALALVAALAVLTGCGEKQETTSTAGSRPLDLMLDYLPNADHVGIYAAQADGYFRRAGLDVKIRVPSDPSAPLKLLAAGKTDLAISYEPEVLLARDKGLRLVAIGAIVQKPLTAIISLGSKHISSPADLRGKRVGTAGIPYQHAYLDTILAQAGVPASSVSETDVGFNLVPAMLSGKVDATLGAFWNYEGVELQRRHKHPSIIRMEQAGVPTYDELVVVARQDELHGAQANAIRRFMRALGQGYEAVRRDPARAVNQLVKANPDLDRGLQLASVKATLPVFFPANADEPFGFMHAGEWRAYANWMQRKELITRIPPGQPLTNEFLPGQGV